MLPGLAKTPDELPDQAGAYLLVLRLGQPEAEFPAGWYLYAGSAYGPGGIRARVRRHMRLDKAIRWHVDRLTAVAESIAALAWPGGGECALVACLADVPGVTFPAPGFGSSDCTRCRAHLLATDDPAPALDACRRLLY